MVVGGVAVDDSDEEYQLAQMGFENG